MKRMMLVTAFILIIFSAYGMKPDEAMAGNVSIGATTWFSWWSPVWEKSDVPNSSETLEFELDPGFITGPLITYRFDELWSISMVFLYWKYSTEDTAQVGSALYRNSRDVHKIESDIIVNYRVSSLIKWFFGFKYQGYFYDETESYITGAVELSFERTVSFHNMGPGMGVGLTVPLFGGLYFLPNISAIILTGYESLEKDVQFTIAIGGNASASLAYYIDSFSTTIAVGCRYQHLFYPYHGQRRYEEYGSDQIYGVTFSFVVAL